MNEVTLFVQTGKNKHDDACACRVMLVELLYITGHMVTVMKRLFKAWSIRARCVFSFVTLTNQSKRIKLYIILSDGLHCLLRKECVV